MEAIVYALMPIDAVVYVSPQIKGINDEIRLVLEVEKTDNQLLYSNLDRIKHIVKTSQTFSDATGNFYRLPVGA
jgi:hypothetical protein